MMIWTMEPKPSWLIYHLIQSFTTKGSVFSMLNQKKIEKLEEKICLKLSLCFFVLGGTHDYSQKKL